jgi:hypothetical protein
MTEENKNDKVIESLSDYELSVITDKLNKERKIVKKGGIFYLLLTLVGPYLPPKIPSFKEKNINYFQLLIVHFLLWGSFYFFSVRELYRLKKDYEERIKINASARVLKKKISKSAVSTKYSIKIEVGNKKNLNLELSQDLFEKVEKNEEVLISYTPHSKTVLEVKKKGSC